ncbi:MAG: hypothetical protein H6935_15970 [Thiobacillus sp.]|nr:hypothetical protein [Thiobacillus sp.]
MKTETWGKGQGAWGLLVVVLALTGCAGSPPPPDWKMNAVSLLEHFQARWLEGDSKAADLALEKSRKEIASTGRLDLLARVELAACGTRAAALDFSPCQAYTALATEAAAHDKVYAQFIGGDWSGLDARLLPPHYAGVASAKDAAAANKAVARIKDPLPRLIAAGLLLRQERAEPATLALATETASERGWRRPLLTWLEVQLKRAQAAGDHSAVTHLKRRIDLAEGTTHP